MTRGEFLVEGSQDWPAQDIAVSSNQIYDLSPQNNAGLISVLLDSPGPLWHPLVHDPTGSEDSNSSSPGMESSIMAPSSSLSGSGQHSAHFPAPPPSLRCTSPLSIRTSVDSGISLAEGPLYSREETVSQVSSTTSVQGFGPSHPLSLAKHICAICGDRASGKHYGVYSCEGCKGFFKRTVRKDLSYTCREARDCVIDKRQRNRCQYCRYQKCQLMGMKREGIVAVQEERQRQRTEKPEGEPESTSNYAADMPPERILQAELASETSRERYMNEAADSMESMEGHLEEMIEWARMIPHFTALPLDDQALLLHTGWNELVLTSMAFRSSRECLVLWPNQLLTRQLACSSGVGLIFDRISTELTAKMHELNMDRTELGCLRTIVLYNPDAMGLKSVGGVESFREKVYSCLEEYCKQQHPGEAGRFAKLLLRLPALRSIGIKSLDSVPILPPIPSIPSLIHALLQIPIQKQQYGYHNMY